MNRSFVARAFAVSMVVSGALVAFGACSVQTREGASRAAPIRPDPEIAASAEPTAKATDSEFAAFDWEALPRDAKAYHGRRVKLVGSVTPATYRIDGGSYSIGHAMTTLLACAPSDPCCNHAFADASLVSVRGQAMGLKLVAKPGEKAFGCSGTECGLTCNPPTGVYEVVGRIAANDQGTIDLEVESMVSKKP